MLHLQDQQGELVRRLSEIIDVDVLQREDGGVDITIGNGRALVIGENDYPVTTSQAGGVIRIFRAVWTSRRRSAAARLAE